MSAPKRLQAMSLFAVLGGCAPESSPVAAGSSREGGVVVVGVAAEATTALPALAAAALDFEIGGALFLGLNYGEWEGGALDYQPGHPLGLARSWEIEGATLTYHLDTDRTWSDGVPITAGDVRFTYGLLADPELALTLSSVSERVDSVSTPDDSTVVFHFDGVYPGMLFDTGVGILPAHVYGEVPRDRLIGGMPVLPQDGNPLVGSGPFVVSVWEPADRIELVRNPASPYPSFLDRLVIRVVPEETTRLAELRAGSLDAAQINDFGNVRRAVDAGMTVQASPQRGYDYIAWNPAGHVAFRERSVRQALSLAIDRAALIEALDMSGFAEPAWGPYGSLFASLREPPPREPLYDPDLARRLLEESGWVDSDGDGVRDRAGTALAFELAIPAGNLRRESAAQVIQQALAGLGVGVTLRPQEFNSLLGRVIAGDYEAALLGWQVGLDPDISPFWADPGSPLNVVSFDDATVRAAIDSARAQTDESVANPFWRAAGAAIADQYPYAFLWFFDLPFVVVPRMRGVEVTATGWGATAGQWSIVPDTAAGAPANR